MNSFPSKLRILAIIMILIIIINNNNNGSYFTSTAHIIEMNNQATITVVWSSIWPPILSGISDNVTKIIRMFTP